MNEVKAMIAFEDAYIMADRLAKDRLGCAGIASAKDIGDTWIFFVKSKNAKPLIGVQPIAICKEDGSFRPFFLPNINNFELLHNAEEIEI